MGDFEQVYFAEYACVARTVHLIVRDAARAEDFTQEAFVRLYLRWGTSGNHERPGDWVRRVAIRASTREAHRERLRSLLDRRASSPAAVSDLDVDVLQAVRNLPPRRRAALVLFYSEDQAVAEIAATLGTSESAAEVRLRRARQTLATWLGEEVDDALDRKLRESFEQEAAAFAPAAPGEVEAVITTARRRRADRRRTAGAVLVLAVALGMEAILDRHPPTPPLVMPNPLPSASPSAIQDDHRATDRRLAAALVGRWTTEVITPQAASAAVAHTGAGAYRDQVLQAFRFPGTLTLEFDDLTYRAKLDGKLVDRGSGSWSVSDGKVILVPDCTISWWCSIVLGPRIHDGVLALAPLEDHSPDVDRVPDFARATVIYGSAPFHRPR
jgi:RNA polymerase sigma-70 factor (ECF subfamily)